MRNKLRVPRCSLSWDKLLFRRRRSSI
jgi:hypothetical protein